MKKERIDILTKLQEEELSAVDVIAEVETFLQMSLDVSQDMDEPLYTADQIRDIEYALQMINKADFYLKRAKI